MNVWLQRLFLVCLLMLAYAAEAAPPPTTPQLLIEAAMHRRPVHRVDADASGRWLVTVSDDKSARVWDSISGQLLRVIRPPIVNGNEGRLFSVAVSPDGNTIALAGFTCREWDGAYCIYLFDRISGRMLKRLKGMAESIYHLAYSPDGKYLAAAIGGKQGIRVWPLALDPSGVAVMSDTAVGAETYAVAWTKDGRLASTCLDGKVRLYKVADKSLSLAATMATPSGQRPEGLAFSPDGNELAVGQSTTPKVDIFDGRTLAIKHSVSIPNSGGGNAGLGSVAWTSDGKVLAAAGRWSYNGQHPIRRWAQSGRGAASDIAASVDQISWLTSLPDGRIAGVAFDPILGVLRNNVADNKAWQVVADSPTADPRPLPTTRDLFRISSDGRRVQFSFDHSNPKATYQFDLPKRRLFNETDNTMQAPRLSGLPVNQWRDSEFPYFADEPIGLEPFEIARSLSVDVNGGGFVLGTSWWIRRFTAQGGQLWEQPVSATAWSVNQPKVAKLLVVAHGDGVIRWHRIEDGKEILAFYPHVDRKRWVLWTPGGYYDSSIGGQNLLGWQVNRGSDQAADFFPAGHFREKFHRPDIIDRVLQTLDEKRAETIGGTAVADQILQSLPPVVDFLNLPGPDVSQRTITLRARARTSVDAPVQRWQLRVNGLLQNLPEVNQTAAERDFSVRLDCDVCDISLHAYNKNGVSPTARWRVNVQSSEKIAVSPGKLLVLAVGISKYQSNEVAKAATGAKDAELISAALAKQKGAQFAEVQTKVLLDGEATKAQIESSLVWLQQTAKPGDLTVILLSGHGFNDSTGAYSFLPTDVRPDSVDSTSISIVNLSGLLSRVQGRTLVMLDTVYADNVLGVLRKGLPHYINRVVNQLSSPDIGAVVISSTNGRQTSQLDVGRTGGLFAKAVVEGLEGKAAGANGIVTHKLLSAWLESRLPDLAHGVQSPGIGVADGVVDFPLASKR